MLTPRTSKESGKHQGSIREAQQICHTDTTCFVGQPLLEIDLRREEKHSPRGTLLCTGGEINLLYWREGRRGREIVREGEVER